MSLPQLFFAEFDTLRIVLDTIDTNIIAQKRKESTNIGSYFQN